jgi:hypothetical protein
MSIKKLERYGSIQTVMGNTVSVVITMLIKS